jgi:hypothetical protein
MPNDASGRYRTIASRCCWTFGRCGAWLETVLAERVGFELSKQLPSITSHDGACGCVLPHFLPQTCFGGVGEGMATRYVGSNTTPVVTPQSHTSHPARSATARDPLLPDRACGQDSRSPENGKARLPGPSECSGPTPAAHKTAPRPRPPCCSRCRTG